MIVPLVAQGELVGALYLGPRLSDQGYSTDDRKLLAMLAGPGVAGDPRRGLIQQHQGLHVGPSLHPIWPLIYRPSVRERQEAPRFSDPFELMLAAILEAQS